MGCSPTQATQDSMRKIVWLTRHLPPSLLRMPAIIYPGQTEHQGGKDRVFEMEPLHISATRVLQCSSRNSRSPILLLQFYWRYLEIYSHSHPNAPPHWRFGTQNFVGLSRTWGEKATKLSCFALLFSIRIYTVWRGRNMKLFQNAASTSCMLVGSIMSLL